jgi:hypothetical protein
MMGSNMKIHESRVLLSLLLINLVCSAAQAATVLLQGVSSPLLDYKATLEAHADFISPVDSILNSRPTHEHKERLISDFAQAQRTFLDKSSAEAEEKFKSVLELLPLDDWNTSERGIFLFSYFRLAQLTSDSAIRDKWLSQSLLLKARLSADQMAQIPPPLIARQSELFKQSQKITLKPLAGWDKILINGMPCRENSCGEWWLSAFPVRITFLSNQWQPQTVVTELSKFASLRPKQTAWDGGSCESSEPQRAATAQFRKVITFWSLECDRIRNLPIQAIAPSSIPRSNAPSDLGLFNPPKPKKAFYKSPWFWTGVGVVAAVIVVNSTQHRRGGGESTTTTTSYGVR